MLKINMTDRAATIHAAECKVAKNTVAPEVVLADDLGSRTLATRVRLAACCGPDVAEAQTLVDKAAARW